MASTAGQLRLTQMHSHATCCPTCGDHHFSRSQPRGVIERYLLPIVQIRPYRCTNCYERFYSRNVVEQKSQ